MSWEKASDRAARCQIRPYRNPGIPAHRPVRVAGAERSRAHIPDGEAGAIEQRLPATGRHAARREAFVHQPARNQLIVPAE